MFLSGSQLVYEHQTADSKEPKRMQQLAAFRPLVAAGAAAVGASLIALTPAVSNDAAADLQRSVVSVQHHAVELADTVVNPIETWVDTLQTAYSNAQVIANTYRQVPAPVLQQVAANWANYAGQYVGNYQTAAFAAVNYFLGTAPSSFVPRLLPGIEAAQAGDFTDAFSTFYNAFWLFPIAGILSPLEDQLFIPQNIFNNLASGWSYATNAGLQSIGGNYILGLPQMLFLGTGQGLQNIYNAAIAGSPLGVATNVLNFPGLVTNFFLNGPPTGPLHGSSGLLSAPSPTNKFASGALYSTVQTVLPGLQASIVAPGSQNVMQGGSLAVAIQNFLYQLVGGWPSAPFITDSFIKFVQTFGSLPGIGGPGTAASVGNLALAAPTLNTLSVNLASAAGQTGLAGMSALSADIAAAVGNLGGGLASRLPAMLLGLLRL